MYILGKNVSINLRFFHCVRYHYPPLPRRTKSLVSSGRGSPLRPFSSRVVLWVPGGSELTARWLKYDEEMEKKGVDRAK